MLADAIQLSPTIAISGRDFGPPYIVSSMLFLTGLMSAAIMRNERFYQVYAIFFLVQTIAISFALFRTLM
jgi:hypothetical protein